MFCSVWCVVCLDQLSSFLVVCRAEGLTATCFLGMNQVPEQGARRESAVVQRVISPVSSLSPLRHFLNRAVVWGTKRSCVGTETKGALSCACVVFDPNIQPHEQKRHVVSPCYYVTAVFVYFL